MCRRVIKINLSSPYDKCPNKLEFRKRLECYHALNFNTWIALFKT